MKIVYKKFQKFVSPGGKADIKIMIKFYVFIKVYSFDLSANLLFLDFIQIHYNC